MSTQLEQNLNLILNEKETKILPENIKQGVTILGVTGTFTTNATATPGDISLGKTAYVNGEKVTGTIPELTPYTGVLTMDQNGMGSDGDGTIGYLNSSIDKDTIVRKGTNVSIMANNDMIANVIGLTADKIVKGNSFLGVEGTAEAGSQINNQDKTITQNGQYTADSGYTGLGTVTVNVPSGSGDVKLFETVEAMQADPNPSEGDLAVVYREEIQPVTEENEFSSCIFPNTVVLDSAFSGDIYGSFRGTDISWTNGSMHMTSSNFSFTCFGFSIHVRVEYTSQDGITYTRTDGGKELQEFGETIKWKDEDPFDDVIGNFMKIGGKYFGGLYEYKSNEYVMTKNQLNATPDYVYKKIFYGKNGVENGTLTTSVSNSFTDVNAEVYVKIQAQYNNMQPRILTDQDKDIDSDIRIIPSKTDGTPLLNTSKVTNMEGMFNGCTNLTTIPLLDTSNVTSMNYMFTDCTNLTTIPLLDTSSATDTSYMFNGCTSLTTIPLLNTSKVTNMRGMFNGCTNLTTIPELDTSSVTNMGTMFSDCSKLTTIPLLNTSNITSMYYMFDGCTSLNNESLNNILAMCANAAKITSNKTLMYIGLTEEQANICQSLSNYQDFINAGWTTGY